MATLAASAFTTERNRPVCGVARNFIVSSLFSETTSEAYDIEPPAVSQNCQNLVKGLPCRPALTAAPF